MNRQDAKAEPRADLAGSTRPAATGRLKQCSICGGWFPATAEYFYSNYDRRSAGRKSLRGNCKACHVAAVRDDPENDEVRRFLSGLAWWIHGEARLWQAIQRLRPRVKSKGVA